METSVDMEDPTGHSASNPDEFLNNTPTSTLNSAVSIDETETQCSNSTELAESSGETLSEKGDALQVSGVKGSDEIIDAKLNERNSSPLDEASLNDGLKLSEQVETAMQGCKMNSQDAELVNEVTTSIENDSNINSEADTTQGHLQLSENGDSTVEDSTATEPLKDANVSEESDNSAQLDVSTTNDVDSSLEPSSEGTTGKEDETGNTESQTVQEQQTLQSLYHIKWIKWKGINTPIITQNENGPCPLLAIVNVLLLQRRINLPSLQEFITSGQLMEYIGDCILEESPKRLSEGAQLNYEQNMHDAIAIMNKLQTGLDVNVKFTGVSDFEFTPECIVFDLLSIGLYHGWLIDPQNTDTVSAVGGLSYNQLVEKIIASKQDGAESQLVSEGLIGEAFLEQTASQLTYHGLCELNSKLQDDQLCVFFRNNHFSTFHKHKDELFLLVTDQGFLTEDRVIWESLANVEGDSSFVDAEFRSLPVPVRNTPQPTPTPLNHQLSQEDQDYLVALSLVGDDNPVGGAQTQPGGSAQPQALPSQGPQGPTEQSTQSDQEWSDLQLAMQLQEEERRQQQQQQQRTQSRPQQAHASPARSTIPPQSTQRSSNSGQQRTESNDKCIIL